MALREKVLIIGNGFDLYHELPTKYSQFIKVLMNIEALNIEDKEITFDDLFKDIDRNAEMKIRFDAEKMVFDKDKITEIKNNLQNNSWYNSFKTKLTFENWIDIENEIKTTLKIIDKIITEINHIIKTYLTDDEIYINVHGYNLSLKLNSEELQYLFNFGFQEKENNEIIDITLLKRINNSNIEFKKEQFYENLFTELQAFTNTFNLYLESIVGLFYENIDSKYASTLEDLKQNINSFYTFNYTPTLEKLYGIEKVNYLHGKHRLENHNIVLGIEEVDPELQNDKIFMFTKYYQKLFNDTDYEFLSNTITTKSKCYDFIFFGHSLAENDQNYIKEVFSESKKFENTVTIFFLNQSDKAQKLKNLLHIVGRVDIEVLMKKKTLTFIKIEDKPFEKLIKNLPKSLNTWGESRII